MMIPFCLVEFLKALASSLLRFDLILQLLILAQKDLKSLNYELLLNINLFDYNHICNFFLSRISMELSWNNESLCSHQKVHSKKLLALTKDISTVSHDPKIVIFNFSKYNLTKQEKSLLSKGLQFAISLTEIEYPDFILPFELIYRDIRSEEVPSENHNNLKNKLLDTATSPYTKIKNCRKKSNLRAMKLKPYGI